MPTQESKFGELVGIWDFIKEDLQELEAYLSSHCPYSGTVFEFNIKAPVRWPEQVERLVEKYPHLEMRAGEFEGLLRIRYLSDFMAELMLDYDWMDIKNKFDRTWWQEGRSGGWLQIKYASYDALDSWRYDYDYFMKLGLKKEAENLAKKVHQLVKDVEEIDQRVKEAVEKFKIWCEDIKTWMPFLEQVQIESADSVPPN